MAVFRYSSDAKKMIDWFSKNITKFRPSGTKGNNFHARKSSHGPMFGGYAGAESSMTSLGGFGEKKFSGYTTKSTLKNPSHAQHTAIRLLKPL